MHRLSCCLLCVVAIGLAGCASSDWNNSDALAAKSLELQVDESGHQNEVEYKVDPSTVPAPVRASMDRLHPGGPFKEAEKEWVGGALYYELTRVVAGMEVEAMFHPNGTLHQEEIQVSPNKISQAMKDAIRARFPRGRVTKWEEIRDEDRQLIEYHVKLVDGDKKFKVALDRDARIGKMWREIPAEVEVPVSSR